MVVIVGLWTRIFPVPTDVLLHEPVNHFHIPEVPNVPPLKLSCAEFPIQTAGGVENTEVGFTDCK